MNNYTPPTDEQLFVLRSVARTSQTLPDDIISAVAEGAAAFALGEFAPLNRVGDTIGARWTDGRVIMPDGFKAAYTSYVSGGWGTLDGPLEYGGQGLPFILATVVLENLGTANMALALCPMLTVGAIDAIFTHGNEEQRSTYLPKLISGAWTGAMNLTEPQAGSDVGALRTAAALNRDGSFNISGTKIYITFGEHDLADNIIHLVLARTPGGPPGTKGISLFLVPKFRPDADGNFVVENDVRCTSIERKLGIHASPTCTMSFGDTGDCKGWLVGPEMGGMGAMFTMMNNARLNVGLQGVQIGERATQEAVGYARGRVQGGKPIIEYPDIRRMLLRMKALTQAARALVYAAASYADRDHRGVKGAKDRLDLLTPLAKAYGTDVGCEIASLGIQIYGGMGFVEETGAAQYYRDIRIAPIYEGTNGIQAADLVGRKLVGDSGVAMMTLLRDIREDAANEPTVLQLAEIVEQVAKWLLSADSDDRLAGSYPFLTMISVVACGGLMARQGKIARELLASGQRNSNFLRAKLVTVRYYLDHLVPEAIGKAAAATAGAALLYELSAEELAA